MKLIRRDRSGATVVIGAATLAFVTAAPLWAAVETKSPPSPERGHALAQKFCTNCHVIDDSSNTTVPAGVPAFRGIANKPGQTGQNIMNVLIKPHTPMPDMNLTRDEIVDIISYLETLRTNEAVPPLLPPSPPVPQSPKPEHS